MRRRLLLALSTLVGCTVFYSGIGFSKEDMKWESPLKQQCIRKRNFVSQKRLLALKKEFPYKVQPVRIDPTNFGLRISKDVNNKELGAFPTLIILHETDYEI